MKIVLAAINAKYIHSNLAVYSLRAYAARFECEIKIKEYTINQYTDTILADLYREKADLLAFSCYIWNIGIVKELVSDISRLCPGLRIWLGGPEVSYDPEKILQENSGITGIMLGEGEKTFAELLCYYLTGKITLSQILGIAYRDPAAPGQIRNNGWRYYLEMDHLPFPYADMKDFTHKIVYYETSRGCPFHCSYCLSPSNWHVRFRSMKLVEKELQFFIDHAVPQVKFVDRTFNCNKEHAMAIWQYIRDHDRGMTNFHFEIGADLLDEEELDLLAQLRPGLVQLEIGVQSTNDLTISEVSRTMDLDRLAYAVKRLQAGRNMHLHLDLIAGLPYEDYDRFRQSFNEVFALQPDQLQLGFLKVLKGSRMYRDADRYDILYHEKAPYEVMRTRWLSYDDILRLKQVEEMVEVYYNSHQFDCSVSYLLHAFTDSFALFEALAGFYAQRGLFGPARSRMQRYDYLRSFAQSLADKAGDVQRASGWLPEEKLLQACMLYDLYIRENLKSRPAWAGIHSPMYDACERFYQNADNLSRYLPSYVEKGYTARQILHMTHLEVFDCDVPAAAKSGCRGKEQICAVLFDYALRDPLSQSAKTTLLPDFADYQ